MVKKRLKGKNTFTDEGARELLQKYYDFCDQESGNNDLPDESRAKLSSAATRLSHIISDLLQQEFAGWTKTFQDDAAKLETTVAEVQENIARLTQAKVTAQKIADFAKIVDDSLTIAAGVAKSFH